MRGHGNRRGRASCQNNLKQFGLVFKMYANEAKGGMFPIVSPQGMSVPGIMTLPDAPSIYPEYLTDAKIFVCPSSARVTEKDMVRSDGSSILDGDLTRSYDVWKATYAYTYLGYMFDLIEDGDVPTSATPFFSIIGLTPPAGITTVSAQIVNWYLALFTKPSGMNWSDAAGRDAVKRDLEGDITVPSGTGNAYGTTIYRLREGIERFMITDINNPAASARAQSEIFMMMDAVSVKTSDFSHVPGGSNVLYMDGHVSFIRYPTQAPVNKNAAMLGYSNSQ